MSTTYRFDDSHDLILRVHFVLSRNPYLGRSEIQCEVIDANVVLTGRVRSYYQKQMAQESIRIIEGIKRIRNELAVVRS